MTSNATNLIVVTGGDRGQAYPHSGRCAFHREAHRGDRIAGGDIDPHPYALAEDRCESEACKATSAAIARAEPDLARIFGEAMGRIAATERLPNALILAVQEDMAPWLSQFFSRIDFTQFTVTTQPFEAAMITHKEIADMVTFSVGVTPDPGLSIAGALVNIESRHD